MFTPSKLFKYKSFNSDTMELIIADYLYFSNPNKFNDPLDCKISIFDDINDEDELKLILFSLYQKNAEKRLSNAAINLHYNSQKTLGQILSLSQSEAEKKLYEQCMNFDTNDSYSTSINQNLADTIGDIILSDYSKGVLSLAEDSNCPLMWSHYADNHKGLCLGYTIPDEIKGSVHPINYASDSREIKISQICKMLNGDDISRREIENSIFLRKALPWKYEKEWRMISNAGLQNASIYLSEIIFGFRCKNTTIYSVMMSLRDRALPIKFYKIVEVPQKFTLKIEEISLKDQYTYDFPRCLESISAMFNKL